MADLRADGCTLGVHGICQRNQAVTGFRPQDDLVAVGGSLARDRAIGDSGHGDPASSDGPMKLDQLVSDEAFGGASLEGGGLDDVISEPHRPEARRAEWIGNRCVLGTCHGGESGIHDEDCVDGTGRRYW